MNTKYLIAVMIVGFSCSSVGEDYNSGNGYQKPIKRKVYSDQELEHDISVVFPNLTPAQVTCIRDKNSKDCLTDELVFSTLKQINHSRKKESDNSTIAADALLHSIHRIIRARNNQKK